MKTFQLKLRKLNRKLKSQVILLQKQFYDEFPHMKYKKIIQRQYNIQYSHLYRHAQQLYYEQSNWVLKLYEFHQDKTICKIVMRKH